MTTCLHWTNLILELNQKTFSWALVPEQNRVTEQLRKVFLRLSSLLLVMNATNSDEAGYYGASKRLSFPKSSRSINESVNCRVARFIEFTDQNQEKGNK